MIKKIIKIILISLILLVIPYKVVAEDSKPGYSEWSETPSGKDGEISAIQYGKILPIEWSYWSSVDPSGFTQDYKSKPGQNRFYAYDNNLQSWQDVGAKSLFTWDFGYKANVVFAYLDVDTYRQSASVSDNYEAPPLQLLCDGQQVASTGVHDVLKNWNPRINVSCNYLELKMSANEGEGRNRTVIVGTWVATRSTQYAYVTKWGTGTGWRFTTPYERVYGSDPQKPTERTVYSYPLTYRITYNLNGGEFADDTEVSTNFTVNDEVIIPTAYKKGYEFLGFYDENDNKLTKIEKGTCRNITLTAKYKRNPPVLYVGYTYFDKSDTPVLIDDLISRVNARAIDELDGDISSQIKVSSIVYEQDDSVSYNPDSLDISRAGRVYISFYVYNSENVIAQVQRRYYILDYGENIDDFDSDIKIYSRYIDEDFKNTLAKGSLWKDGDYAAALNKAYKQYRED